ncbi:MAG TPA: hypothetical protein VJ827_10875 [Rubrobacter sp.]|nr:hypothetical protein [Rubrobacter sp.]
MARYHFGYHDYPLAGEDCPVCQERDDRVGEEEAIAAAEATESDDAIDAHYSCLERMPEASLDPEDDLTAIVEHHKEIARSRGWLTGDINQTDTWFRGPDERAQRRGRLPTFPCMD